MSEGGKIAERFGDASFQRGLVVFDGEQIMTFAIADMLADLALREDRVAGDDPTIQRQCLEQHHGSDDLVLVRRDRKIADHGPQFDSKRGQNVDRFVVEAAAAFEGLAVDGDVL